MKEIRTKNSRIINKNTLLVTVDIGKTTNMGYYRIPEGTAVELRRLTHARERRIGRRTELLN